MQQRLNVISQDSVGGVLRRQDTAINQRRTAHALQRLIGFLLGPHDRLIAFLAAADNIEGDIEISISIRSISSALKPCRAWSSNAPSIEDWA
jgi:hypothetical protein